MLSSGISDRRILSALGQEAARDFQALQHRIAYPKGEKLFAEGARPSGIFVLSAGGARLTVSDSAGNRLVSRKALPGEVLGLSATVSGRPHQVTAQTTASCELGFIRRDDFLHFLREHPGAAFRVVELLSTDLTEAPLRTRRSRPRRAAN